MRNVLFIGAASVLFSACTASEAQETEELNGEAYGMITIPSTVTSSSGNVYAFHIPMIEVSGENGQYENFSFMSETWEPQIYEIDLAVGEYMVMLHDAHVFRLDEAAEGWEHVDAELVSDNPQWVSIYADQSSQVQFVFMVNGEEVEFSSGSLDIQLDVVEDEPDDADPYEDDVDGDGWLAGWEDCNDHDPTIYPGAPEVLDGLDNDCDGLVDESDDPDLYQMDSDWDGLSDGEEMYIFGTNPYQWDSDWDGLNDFEEIMMVGTDPLNMDTDGDEILDGDEVQLFGTDPHNPDSDEDELSDGEEFYIYGTDPTDWDSDNDGLSDGEEVYVYGTNPNLWDTDGDGMDDQEEQNPMWADTDGDGLIDWDENYYYGTDPLMADSDWDGLTDYEEVHIYGTDPMNPDTNGNGIFDGDEF